MGKKIKPIKPIKPIKSIKPDASRILIKREKQIFKKVGIDPKAPLENIDNDVRELCRRSTVLDEICLRWSNFSREEIKTVIDIIEYNLETELPNNIKEVHFTKIKKQYTYLNSELHQFLKAG